MTRGLLAWVLGLGVVFAPAVSFSDPAPGVGPDPILIGSILILTGEGASWGTAARNGIDMALESVNQSGGLLGRKIVVDHQDDQGDPKKSIAAFRYLTEVKGVRIIIGTTWSTLGLPLADMAARRKVLMISPSLGMAKFNESSPFLFNTWPHDFVLAEKLADYIYARGRRRAALIGAEDVWVKEQTAAFKKRFESLGGSIALLTEPLPGTTDVKSEALKIKERPGVDAVVSTTDGVVVGSLVAKALKDLDVRLPIYSITVDQAAIDAAQGGFEGLEFLTFLTPRPEFKKSYEERFKTQIDIGADSAYDAVMMLAQAVRAAGSTDAARLAAQLSRVKEYDGVSGRLISDGRRGFTKDFAVKRVRAGRAEDLAAPAGGK